MLIKTLKDVEFDVFCIMASEEKKPWAYEKLPNVNQVIVTPLIRGDMPKKHNLPKADSANLVEFLKDSSHGATLDLESLIEALRHHHADKGWLQSRSYWDFVTDSYQENYPEGSFMEYFWTVFGLNSIMLDSLSFINEIPEADIYHSLSTGFAGFAASMAKVAHKRPMVITEQGLYVVERRNELSRQNVSEWYRKKLIEFTESMVKTSYKYADKIVPPCYSHMAIEKDLGADVNKITVINNGIEVDRFRPQPRNGGKPVVGCFARVVPVKDITVLIQAAKIVCENYSADFVVLGDIQDKEYYRQCQDLVRKLGLEDNFRFMGHCNALEWYHRVDVFTLSSLSEGVPYALLEAMSCGLPSVCTAVGGIPEIISDDVGYVVPPNQPDSLADRLCDLLESEELRVKMGRRATEVVHEKYTIGAMAEKFRNLYEGLLK
jgi:glycosyltransferase involved in cell wall biosynthesis